MNERSRLPRIGSVAAALASTLPLLAGSAANAPAAASPAGATGVINGLGARLQHTLTEAQADANSNLVFSPASIAIALTMTSLGAGGDTLAEMNETLGIVDPSIHGSMGALAELLTTGQSADSFTLTNSLWVQDGFAIEDAFATTLTDTYRSEPFREDFQNEPAAAVDDINDWVADATADRITDLLSEGDISAATRLVLANAVHVDAEWAHPFAPDSTRPDAFTRGDGSTVEADFMHQTLHAAQYGEANGGQAVVLPYTNGYEMVVVLPPDGELAEFEQALADSGDFDAALGQVAGRDVVLSLPKWDIETRSNLVSALQTMGMTLPFDPANADFTKINSEVPLAVSGVIHLANITVDEAGTEAGAATGVVIVASGAPIGSQPEPAVMNVDRPFFFAIRHTDTGAITFQGHVSDPAGAAGFG